jgi:hypothetical protein
MPSFVKTVVCVMLGAGGATPAYRHAHLGGDAAHTHSVHRSHHASEPSADDHDHHHGHGHSHAHHNGHSHHEHTDHAHHDDVGFETDSKDQTASDNTLPVNHVHLVWLGFEFTFPEPAKEPKESQDAETWQFITQISSPMVIGSDAHATPVWGAMHSTVVPKPLSALPCLDSRFSVKTCLSNPLCDTARHERSGVQLA